MILKMFSNLNDSMTSWEEGFGLSMEGFESSTQDFGPWKWAFGDEKEGLNHEIEFS